MRRSTLLCLPLLALTTSSALMASSANAAAVSPPGVNLRWDNCYGDGGAWNKNFACDTNSGSEALVCSFELDQSFSEASGAEIYLDLSSQSVSLPPWWTYKNAGACRQASLGAAFLTAPPGSRNCIDWAQGQGMGGIAAYAVGYHGPSTARIIAGIAVPPSGLVTLVPGQEYFALSVTINHAKTVGTGSCAGCTVPVCIFLQRIVIVTPPVAGQPSRDLLLERGANDSGSQYATWQNGYPINIQRECDPPPYETCFKHYNSFDCVLATPTSSRGSTWGRVKSLYR